MKPAVLKTMLRGETLWGVVLLVGMANALLMAVRAFGQGPALLHPGLGAGAEFTSAAVWAMVAFCAAAILGMLATGALLELTSCGFTWSLPGFREAARRDLWILAALAWLPSLGLLVGLDTADLAGEASRPGGPLLGVLVLPSIGLAAGLAVFDPRLAGWPQLACAVAILAPLLFMEHLLLWNAPLVLVPAAAAAAVLVLVLRRSAAKAPQRELLLGGEVALTHANRHPFAPQPWERAERRGRLIERVWSGGADAFRTRPLEVLEFERWGWSRGTWPLGRLGPAGLAALLMLVTTFLFAQRVGLDLEAGRRLFLGLVWNARLLDELGAGEDDVLHMVLPGALFLTYLSVGDRMQPSLRVGALYPMSRRQRAELLWRGGLVNWTRVFLASALVLGLLAGVAAWSSGLPFGRMREVPTLGDGPPYLLICLFGCAALLPILQLGASLRELYPGERLTPWKALLTMIFLASLFVGLLYAAVLNLAELHAFEQWTCLTIAPVVAVAGQIAWRMYLQARMRIMDLC